MTKQGKSRVVCDPEVSGLRKRFNRNGSVVWLLRLRIAGRDTTLTVGPVALTIRDANEGKLTEEEARDLARAAKASDDPYAALNARQRFKGAGPTVRDLADLFYRTEYRDMRPTSQRTYRIWIDKHILPRFGDTAVADIVK
ncbi:MAG TPA: hypothetical protein VKA19_11150, partial [Alphaproteobacteria bacterium]|nr:hypothetical protein [Alphaproteobacteria bacterium]